MTGPIPPDPDPGLAAAYLGLSGAQVVPVVQLEAVCRAVQQARVAPPVPVAQDAPGGEGVADQGGVGGEPGDGDGPPPAPPLEDGPPEPPVDDGAPPPPGPVAGPVIAQVVVPPTAVVAQDLTDAIRHAIQGARQDATRAGLRYRIGQQLVEPCSMEWCVAGVPDQTLLEAANQYLRLRQPGSTATDAVLLGLPPLVDGFDVPSPYGPDRAVLPHFEYWVNHVFREIGNEFVAATVRRLLSGTRDGAAAARWLPRSQEERAARTQELEQRVQGSLAARAWLDDAEAVAVMDILVRYGYRVMDPVAAVAARNLCLRPLGANTSGYDGTLAIGYHGNGRTPGQTEQTGTAPRARWGQIGQDNAWHPFSIPRGRLRDGYFRMASGDNELETTVSIAQRPHESLDFPLIAQVLNAIPACQAAIQNNEQLPADDYGNGTVVSGQGVATTICWLYVVLIDTIYNTQEHQQAATSTFTSLTTEVPREGAFTGAGELATGSTTFARHVGALCYERVHFGTTREHGHRYRLVEVRDFLPAPASFQDGDTSLYRKFYAGILHDMPLCGVKIATNHTDNVTKRAHITQAVAAYPDPPVTAGLLTTVSQRLAGLPQEDQRTEQQIAQAAALNAVLAMTQTWLHGAGQGAPGAWQTSQGHMTEILAGTRPMPQLP